MKRGHHLLAFYLIWGFAGVARAAAPSVQMGVDVDPKTVYIGDRIAYTLTVVHSSGAAMAPLTLPQPFGQFEVLQISTGTPEVSGDKVRWVTRLELVTFSTGTQTIPTLSLAFSVGEGQMATAQTTPVDINVKSLLTEKGDLGNLRPLKGFVTFRSLLWLWILLSAIVVLLLGLLLYRKLTGRSLLNFSPPPPPVPPEVLFANELRALEASDLIASGQMKEFYSRLSAALRAYLEGRFQMAALERTTTELFSEFRRIQLPTEHQSLLRPFFETADLVKFAKFQPTETEVFDDFNHIKDFAETTKPKPLAPATKVEAL